MRTYVTSARITNILLPNIRRNPRSSSNTVTTTCSHQLPAPLLKAGDTVKISPLPDPRHQRILTTGDQEELQVRPAARSPFFLRLRGGRDERGEGVRGGCQGRDGVQEEWRRLRRRGVVPLRGKIMHCCGVLSRLVVLELTVV